MIPLDTKFDMISAFNPSDPELSYHHKNKIQYQTYVNEYYVEVGDLTSFTPEANWIIPVHGYIMWSAWSVLSMIMIGTNRYLRHKWKWRQRCHTITGSIIALMTLTGGLLSLYHNGFSVAKDAY